MNNIVLEDLFKRCRVAYVGKTPLIMIDTYEYELVKKLILKFHAEGLVELLRKHDNLDYRVTYYSLFSEENLDDCSNYFTKPADLDNFCKNNYIIKNQIGDQQPSQLKSVFSFLVESKSESANSAENAKLFSSLRRYVKMYAESQDDNSALKNSVVMLFGDIMQIPKELQPYTKIITVKYPEIWEIKEIIRKIYKEYEADKTISEEKLSQIAKDFAGFSLIEVEKKVKMLLNLERDKGRYYLFEDKERLEILMEEKAQAINRSGGLLTIIDNSNKKISAKKSSDKKDSGGKGNFKNLGGMGAFSKWVKDNYSFMDERNDIPGKRGAKPLRGILLCGVPGCGKSLAAKTLHKEWGLPMLRMDMDRLMGGYVGESERNLRDALEIAEAMSPCILWIDELDKGFSGANATSNDSSTFKRMFGRLLTWMQEHTKRVFVFATANDISSLPPEFFRSGRFDELFSVYMPTREECKDIFKAQMLDVEERREKRAEANGEPKPVPLFSTDETNGCFTDDCLNGIMEIVENNVDGIKFLTGADIEKIISRALSLDGYVYENLSSETWRKILRKIIIEDKTLSTFGSSSSNLDQIAATYIRLLRGNFVPASDKELILFRSDNYIVKPDEKTQERKGYYECDDKEINKLKKYDRELFKEINKRIPYLATLIENNKTLELCN